MDKLARLRKLTGDDGVVEQSNDFQWVVQPGFENMTASNMYTGESDSDEYANIFNKNNLVQKPQSVPAKSKPKMGTPATMGMSKLGGQTVVVRRSDMYLNMKQYELQLGEFGPEDEEFCPWRAVKEYPWKYIGNANRSKVVEAFYSRNQYLEETWDFFYVHRGSNDANEKPYLLVPTDQVLAFLDTINKTMDTKLTIPFGGSNAGFRLMFDNDGTPRPRYLGRSTNSEMVTNLHRNIPPSYYKLGGEPTAMGTPSSRSLAAFKAKIDMVQAMQRNQKARKSEKKKQERIEKQQDWGHSIKRVQRYLGLRQIKKENQDEVISALRASLESSNLPWSTIDEACNAAAAKLLASPISFDPNVVAPYKPEGHVVFVCVDVEAYERSAEIITEIGIATLDTKDIEMITPGKGFQANTPAEFGKNWISKIRSRHFRIDENKHYHNSEFVSGCADKFEFGESEFIGIKDAPRIIASCFKSPYSKPNATEVDFLDEGGVKRPLILVGHDIGSDVRYLQKLGYDVSNLSNLLETADTASMWRYLKREPNPRNLASILAELGITGWNLHNAGNDATYTLQAMIGIAIQHILDKEKKREDREQEKKARIMEAVKEAHEQALQKEEGWSSSGENTDGGVPVNPVPQSVNKNVFQSRISNIPARPSTVKFDPPKTYFTPTPVWSAPITRPPGWVAPHLRGIVPNSEPIPEKPVPAPAIFSTAFPSPSISSAFPSKSQVAPTPQTNKYDFIKFVPAASGTETTGASKQQTSYAQSTTSSISNPYENVDYDNESVPGNFSGPETFRVPDISSPPGKSPVPANPWSGVLVNSPVKPAHTNTFMNMNTAMQGMGLRNPPVLGSKKENIGESKEERKISPPNWSFTNSENKFGNWETQEEFNKLGRDLRAARKDP